MNTETEMMQRYTEIMARHGIEPRDADEILFEIAAHNARGEPLADDLQGLNLCDLEAELESFKDEWIACGL